MEFLFGKKELYAIKIIHSEEINHNLCNDYLIIIQASNDEEAKSEAIRLYKSKYIELCEKQKPTTIDESSENVVIGEYSKFVFSDTEIVVVSAQKLGDHCFISFLND